jgi:hypothetical protein
MTEHFELHHPLIARGDRLSDAHLGLLLGDLRLGAGITRHPERYRQALALVANAVGRLRTPDGDASRGDPPAVRAA